MKSKKTIVDLFAGAGGLSYGFEQTGSFNVVAAVEIHKSFAETYKKNNPEVTLFCRDISEINFQEEILNKHDEIDVVIGGPPCQGFSNANRQSQSVISKSNWLIKEYVRAVRELNPKAFVMENVPTIRTPTHLVLCSTEEANILEKHGLELKKTSIILGNVIEGIENDDGFISYLMSIKEKHPARLFSPSIIDCLKKIESGISKNAHTEYFSLQHFPKISELKSALVNSSNGYTDHYSKLCNTLLESLFQSDSPVDALSLDGASTCKNVISQILICQDVLSNIALLNRHNISIYDITITENKIEASAKAAVVYNYLKVMLGQELGYTIADDILNAADFGASQKRRRFFMIGIKPDALKGDSLTLPSALITSEENYYTVQDAIGDLENCTVTCNLGATPQKRELPENKTPLEEYYLSGKEEVTGHVTTDTRDMAKKRFSVLKEGQNFLDLPSELKTTYGDEQKTQRTIYYKLRADLPSPTVVNIRKSMWVHPHHPRAMSIREAARLQSFPDSFEFCGKKDDQYQQIGNAVPPLLGWAVAEHLLELMGDVPNKRLGALLSK